MISALLGGLMVEESGEQIDEVTKMRRLHEAFEHFTSASKALEQSYGGLKERVRYLTEELEQKNRELASALSQTEEAKDYLGGILDSLSEAIIVVDPEGTVTMVNRAAGRMMAARPDEIVGLMFSVLGIPEGNTEDGEAELRTPVGKLNVIVSRSAIMDAEGTVRGTVVLLQDITRLKALEEAQERNHRLIAMGEMAAKIVHEIRSPLCSIELYSSMLARDLEGTKHTEMAEGISSGIKSLNNVLTNMLFFAKPRQAAPAPADLGRTLQETLFILKPMADTHGVALELSGATSGRALCDTELVKQVLMNIILNAIQASPEGAKVRIVHEETPLCETIEIHDEGPGISKENMARIFDPFFSTKDRGTGLGLAISARIMEAHQGAIKVQSEPGRGTSFYLSLPREGYEGGCTL